MLKISLLFKKYELQRKITREFLGLRMRNFQGSVFIWIQTYREIFKSALVYLSKGDQINSKKGVGFFQISRKEILFFFISWRYSHDTALFLALSKNPLPFPFSLAKKRIYLDTHLKEELTDLFWKLPGCFLFPQKE